MMKFKNALIKQKFNYENNFYNEWVNETHSYS